MNWKNKIYDLIVNTPIVTIIVIVFFMCLTALILLMSPDTDIIKYYLR